MRSTLKNTPFKSLAMGSALALTTGFFSATTQAAEIATDPGDYTPLPAGVNLGILYGQYATRDTVYADGDKVPVDAGLNTIIGLARFVHYMDIGGVIVDPQIIVPFGKVARFNPPRKAALATPSLAQLPGFSTTPTINNGLACPLSPPYLSASTMTTRGQ